MLVNDDHGVREAPPAPKEADAGPIRKLFAGVMLATLAAAMFAGGMLFTTVLLGGPDGKTPAASTSAVPSERESAVEEVSGLVPYDGALSGIRFSYPGGWTVTADTSEHLILGIEGETGMSVRRDVLESPVDTTNVQDIRAVTDAILSSPEASLRMVTTDEVVVNGLPGIFYLYYFHEAGGDGTGAARGVHAHYLLFQGDEMYSLVFQVVPADQFATYATTFDRVLETFRTR